MNHKYIECECGCGFHLIRFSWFSDLEDTDIYLTIYLNTKFSFLRRVWLAIRFILGSKPIDNCFGSIILNHNKIKELEKFFNDFLTTHFSKPITPEEKIKVAKMVVALRRKALENSILKLKKLEES